MNKQQGIYTTAFILLVFILGGVLLPATRLTVFNTGNGQTIAYLTLLLIALIVVTLVGIAKAAK